MRIEDYALYLGEIEVTIELDNEHHVELTYDYDTSTEFEWYSPDGYHEMEVPFLVIESIDCTSVKFDTGMTDKDKDQFDSDLADGMVFELLEGETAVIERMIKEDY